MKVIGAIDLDGVIMDNQSEWLVYYNAMAEKHNHRAYCEYEDIKTWGFFENLCKLCLDNCLHDRDITLGCKPFPGSLDGIRALANTCDELYLVTHRPEDIAQYTIENLKNNGFDGLFTDYYIGRQSKRDICLNLHCNFLVDDKPTTILSLYGTECLPILYDQPWNQEERGFLRTYSLQTVAEYARILKMHSVDTVGLVTI